MQVIQGGKTTSIAGAKVGEAIAIHLLSGKIERGILSDVTKVGIEAFNVDLTNQPLTFYPFNTIVKITKYNELQQQGV